METMGNARSFGKMAPLRIFIFLIILNASLCFAFQSDELPEDDEEWGIVGAPIIEKVAPQYIEPGAARRPLSASGTSDGPATDAKIQINLEHAFGNSEFSTAGLFSARLRTLPHGGQTLTKLRLARNSFSIEEQKAFEDLVKEDGFYKIRVPASVLNPSQGSVMSSVKARCLSAANLQERFDMHMDKGNMIAVNYGAASGCQYPRLLKYPTHWTFDSHIVLKSGEQAQRILTMIEDVAGGVNDGDDQPKKQPERSFWAKYWMYIVPLGLIVLNAITQIANMPEEQATGQGGGAPQGTTQRVASASARRR